MSIPDRDRPAPAVQREPEGFARPVSVADEALLQLVDDLREGLYPRGSSLPNLQELAQYLNISVTNVRVALQRLETAGVVSVRRGRGGGVTVITLDNVSAALQSIFSPTPERQLPALVEAWSTLEREVFLLASRRASQEDLARLAAAIKDLHEVEPGNAAAFQELSFRVHTVAATIARNPFLKRYFSTLMNMLGAVFTARGNLSEFTADRRRLALEQYDGLLQAVVRQDFPGISGVVQDRAELQLQMMGLAPERS